MSEYFEQNKCCFLSRFLFNKIQIETLQERSYSKHKFETYFKTKKYYCFETSRKYLFTILVGFEILMLGHFFSL